MFATNLNKRIKMRNGKVQCYYVRANQIKAIEDLAKSEDVSKNVAMRKLLEKGISAHFGKSGI